jgi:uncharacterized membrane protein YiaA
VNDLPVDLHYKKKLEKTKRMLDIIVYSSSILDITIAVIVVMAHMGLNNPQAILFPVNFLLMIVVALTGVVGVLFLWLKHYEKIIYNVAMFHSHTKNTLGLLARMKLFEISLERKFRYNYNNKGMFSAIKGIFSRQQ